VRVDLGGGRFLALSSVIFPVLLVAGVFRGRPLGFLTFGVFDVGAIEVFKARSMHVSSLSNISCSSSDVRDCGEPGGAP
jgi:hypothetical protein